MEKINEDIIKLVKKFADKLPIFSDGRIDYSNAKTAIVVTVFIKFNKKILLLKRSDKVSTYRGKWNTVAGYIDEIKPVEEKIYEELKEELGIERENIKNLKLKQPFSFKDNKINRTWIINPALVELNKKPEIKLDWEHVEYKWINPRDIDSYDTVPNLKVSLKKGLM
ncbi:MAG: NUDIX domain-containing protein [Candidatus Thermoplasmatota archaeon]|nr:NUDIX domain-containing protein [Candidatus Thermoplasmatota archaeon]